MRFFFPDSLDIVDPTFDFVTETRSETRIRQQDDQYAHEIFSQPPYDGILLSMAAVEGTSDGGGGKYTFPQARRLRTGGAYEFFRLDRSMLTMGDCGAFTYVKEEVPPYTVGKVIDFYMDCKFTYGVSVDHVILGYQSERNPVLPGLEQGTQAFVKRQQITLDLAREFLSETRRLGAEFTPVGVAQGWSPSSYAHSVKVLQKQGYRHLAIGGLVPLKTPEILEVLAAIEPELRKDIEMVHLFGVTRCEHIPKFAEFGVTSFDSTSPLRQAFKDDKDNYYTPHGNYTAIRVPQVDANVSLKRRILSGVVRQEEARRLERECLESLRGYDQGTVGLDPVLSVLSAYEKVHDGQQDHSAVYRQTLQDRPWKECPCEICRKLSIDIVLFRGAERNRRRGFHNLFVFEGRMRKILAQRPRHRIRTSRKKEGSK